jgi:NAD(P)-dependent dehydrogenase (short-subunit alcohol dehydrogenase family)
VTGAGRGIGKAIAELLAKNGVTVICVSKSAESCGSVAAAITASGGKATAVPVDVGDGAAVVKAAEALLTEHGKIDLLINNAGITRDGLLARMSEDDWNVVIQTNLTGAFHWTKAIGWPMCRARYGRIVNIASVVGLVGNAGQRRADRVHQIDRQGIRSPQCHRQRRGPGIYQNGYDVGAQRRGAERGSRLYPDAAFRRSGGYRPHGGLPLQRRGELYYRPSFYR